MIEHIEALIEKWWGRYKHYKYRQMLVPWSYPYGEVADAEVKSDGTFNLRIQNKTGRIIEIGRVVLWVAGLDPTNIHSSSAGEWAGIFKGPGGNIGNLLDFLPQYPGGQMFPQVLEYSGHNALIFRNNEDIYCTGVASTLAVGTRINMLVYGKTSPPSEDFLN